MKYEHLLNGTTFILGIWPGEHGREVSWLTVDKVDKVARKNCKGACRKPNADLDMLPSNDHVILGSGVLFSQDDAGELLTESQKPDLLWGNIFNDQMPACWYL